MELKKTISNSLGTKRISKQALSKIYMGTPTLKEKVEMYERFLHKINVCVITGNSVGIQELVSNADDWSYMHRCGNGELSERGQRELINKKFKKLCNTPKSDLETKTRQKKYEEHQKENSLRGKSKGV